MKLKSTLALSALALATSSTFAQTQGVSKNEILIGSIQDLSGPVASLGKQARFGMQLRVDELNEQTGGIHGRKIRLQIEDSQFDPKKAVLAAQKLVNQDKIFAMVAHMGTTNNLATMPIQFAKNVPNLSPISAATEMYEPYHKLKFGMGITGSYFDQMRTFLPKLVKEKGSKKVCTLYQDDDMGTEIMHGAEAGLKTMGMAFVEKTTYKTGATDFASQVARMKAADCDMVVLGTIVRETIGTINTSKRSGFNPVFVGSSSVYTDSVPKLGKSAMDGLYATMTVQSPYLDSASQPLRFWATKYQTKFNEEPTVVSLYGYIAVDNFIAAAQNAGPNLTTDSLVKALETTTFPSDIFGSPVIKYGPNMRKGTELTRLSQIVDGKWKVMSDYGK